MIDSFHLMKFLMSKNTPKDGGGATGSARLCISEPLSAICCDSVVSLALVEISDFASLRFFFAKIREIRIASAAWCRHSNLIVMCRTWSG